MSTGPRRDSRHGLPCWAVKRPRPNRSQARFRGKIHLLSGAQPDTPARAGRIKVRQALISQRSTEACTVDRGGRVGGIFGPLDWDLQGYRWCANVWERLSKPPHFFPVTVAGRDRLGG